MLARGTRPSAAPTSPPPPHHTTTPVPLAPLQAKMAASVVNLESVEGVAGVTQSFPAAGNISDLSIGFASTASCKAATAHLTTLSALIVIDTDKYLGTEPTMAGGIPAKSTILLKARQDIEACSLAWLLASCLQSRR